jgi:hypothetical protein
MWFFGLVVGVLLGYLFKPQIDTGVQKVVKLIKDSRSDRGGPKY